MATARRLAPNLSFEEFAKKMQCCKSSPLPEDKKIYADFERARSVIEAEDAAGQVLPTWIPASQCSLTKSYGHLIYTKMAAFTEKEFLEIFGKLPAQLSVPAYNCELYEPQKKVALYAVNLATVPEAIRLGCRKIKVYHSAGASLEDQFLRLLDACFPTRPG